jgi:hypothetical protein
MEIQEDIQERVLWVEPSVIQISVREGEVEVAGELESSTDVEIFEQLVQKVPGVVSMRSSVTYRVPIGNGDRSPR